MGYRTSAKPANANTTPEKPMTGPSAKTLVNRPMASTPPANPTARANGFVRSEPNVSLPRSFGKCPTAYSARTPKVSVPTMLPVRWAGPAWANDAEAIPSG